MASPQQQQMINVLTHAFGDTPFDTVDVALRCQDDPELEIATRNLMASRRNFKRIKSLHLRPHLKRLAREFRLETAPDGRWILPPTAVG